MNEILNLRYVTYLVSIARYHHFPRYYIHVHVHTVYCVHVHAHSILILVLQNDHTVSISESQICYLSG